MAEQWTIKREVSLGDLIAVVIAIGSVITAYMSLNARVMVVEATTAQTAADMRSTMNEIKVEIRRLTDRIERVMELKH